METFAIPAVGAIIRKIEQGKEYILVQDRCKLRENVEYGLLEIPAGKIREYEDIFSALRREVKEETGLTINKIEGERKWDGRCIWGYKTISYLPYNCIQNIAGGYSIILQVFICSAEGELCDKTNETQNIHWEDVKKIKLMLYENPERFYPMHIETLEKYCSEFVE